MKVTTLLTQQNETEALGNVARAQAALGRAHDAHTRGPLAGVVAYTYKRHVKEAAGALDQACELLGIDR